jgi:hypothetical protein
MSRLCIYNDVDILNRTAFLKNKDKISTWSFGVPNTLAERNLEDIEFRPHLPIITMDPGLLVSSLRDFILTG